VVKIVGNAGGVAGIGSYVESDPDRYKELSGDQT
jgi:hypothetical protein